MKPPSSAAGSVVEWEKACPHEVLSRLTMEQNKVRSMTAVFSISLDPPPKGRPSHLNGIIFFDRRHDGPVVRIKGLGLFGYLLFDLVQEKDSIEIYIPSRNTLFRGKINNGKETGYILENMTSLMFIDFSKAYVKDGATLSYKNDMVILPLATGELMVGRKDALLREWHRGKQVVLYDRYEQKKGEPPIPTLIRVITDGGAQRAVCSLSQVCLNYSMENVFDLSVYKARFVKDLSDLDI